MVHIHQLHRAYFYDSLSSCTLTYISQLYFNDSRSSCTLTYFSQLYIHDSPSSCSLTYISQLYIHDSPSSCSLTYVSQLYRVYIHEPWHLVPDEYHAVTRVFVCAQKPLLHPVCPVEVVTRHRQAVRVGHQGHQEAPVVARHVRALNDLATSLYNMLCYQRF